MHVIPIFFVPLHRQTIKTYKTWKRNKLQESI